MRMWRERNVKSTRTLTLKSEDAVQPFPTSLHFLHQIFFYNEIVDDEVLTFHCVLSHIICQQLFHLVTLVKRHRLKTHIGSDEILKLIGTNLTQSFESCDFWIRRQALYRCHTFFVTVAIDSFKLCATSFPFCTTCLAGFRGFFR